VKWDWKWEKNLNWFFNVWVGELNYFFPTETVKITNRPLGPVRRCYCAYGKKNWVRVHFFSPARAVKICSIPWDFPTREEETNKALVFQLVFICYFSGCTFDMDRIEPNLLASPQMFHILFNMFYFLIQMSRNSNYIYKTFLYQNRISLLTRKIVLLTELNIHSVHICRKILQYR
jgi:hypothetical protein